MSHKSQENMPGTTNYISGNAAFRVQSARIKMGNHSFYVKLYIPELFYYYKSDGKRAADTRRTATNTERILR